MKRRATLWPPPSRQRGGPDAGSWVLLATLHTTTGVRTVPVLASGERAGVLRRYKSGPEAVGDAYQHSAMRVGGGLALNVCTGTVVMIKPKLRG